MVLRQANTQRELSRRQFNHFLSAQSDPPIHKRAAPLQERENLPDNIGERFAPRSPPKASGSIDAPCALFCLCVNRSADISHLNIPFEDQLNPFE